MFRAKLTRLWPSVFQIPFSRMSTHWLFRVGDGEHFRKSFPYSIWGISSPHPFSKNFIQFVKVGDILWFVETGGLLVAVATYVKVEKRVLGPILNLTLSNEDLGWTKTNGDWDTEIHYKDLYNISQCSLNAGIKSPLTIRRYNAKCKVDLPKEYPSIVRYSKISMKM